jgi:two-component system, cell cycle sensor histidine kinase and response regulator CckA
MPLLTGDKLSKKILDVRPDIPIILCTGHSELITKDKAQAMGIREFIMKPLDMGNLSMMINRVLNNNKPGYSYQEKRDASGATF